MSETKTRAPVGTRRYEWSTDGMREADDGSYLLATDLRLAAPKLLAACKAALDYIGAQSAGETQDQLRAAIAAAEGE